VKPESKVLEMPLGCGARALFVPSAANNIVALTVFFPTGSAAETTETAGLTNFTMACLLRGTQKRSSAELAEAVESLGSSLSFRAHADFSTASLTATADSFQPTLDLFLEALTEPAFAPAEIEKERQITLAGIREELDDKATFAMRTFASTLFAGGTYGIPAIGTLESISSLQREQVISLYNSAVAWEQALVVAVGNFDPDELASRFETSPLALKDDQSPRSGITPIYRKGTIVELTRAWEQAYIVMGFPACPITHRDFFPLRMLAGVLGDGMSSRFFVRLRDERGLAYATSCQLAAYRAGGCLVGTIGTKPGSVDEARELMLRLFSEVCQELVHDNELDRTRNYLVGKYLISHQRNAARAFYLGSYEMAGLSWRMDEEYPVRLKTVHAEDVLEAARQYLDSPTIVQIRAEQ
jgi:predicted Zn-dependent peptidase